jgi:energy-coupling factor transporter ATP-binding protein EcfA2
VFSDYFLFERIVGTGGADADRRARDYLERLHLDHKVSIKGRRVLHDQLSQGQRKRLALLCAYIEDRPFYLFDEWASDQDPVFKEVFYTKLLPELRSLNKAVLVITHDDRYFGCADRLIKLDYGRITGEPPEQAVFAWLRDRLRANGVGRSGPQQQVRGGASKQATHGTRYDGNDRKCTFRFAPMGCAETLADPCRALGLAHRGPRDGPASMRSPLAGNPSVLDHTDGTGSNARFFNPSAVAVDAPATSMSRTAATTRSER